MSKFRCCLSFSIAIFYLLSCNVQAGILNIYVSPTGVDTRQGTDENTAVKSLERVQRIVAAKGKEHDEIRVLFAPGVYRGMSVTWRTFPGVWLRFLPLKPGQNVVFDGAKGGQSVFFRAHAPDPKMGHPTVPMKLEFRGLKIRNYCEGISLRSWNYSANRPGGSENLIVQNTFEYIGSKYDPVVRGNKPRGACAAALRLQGVEKNRVEGNTFQHIINIDKNKTSLRRYGPAHLHAIYIANMSRDNIIKNNKFDDFSGDPIRVRDRSDRNRIQGNEFGSVSAGISPNMVHAVSQWYCNKSIRACVDEYAERKECESADLRVDKDNRISSEAMSMYTNISKGEGTCDE